METTQPNRSTDLTAYTRCLASIERGRIARAKRQARRIQSPAIRAIARDQIRFALKIQTCLDDGDTERARRLTRSLIGGVKLKYETALGILPMPRTGAPASSRPGGVRPAAAAEVGRPAPDLTDLPPDIRDALEQLTRQIERARAGERHPAFPPSVLLHLGRIACRAWLRRGGGTGLSPLRASATEIRIAGACLRRRIEGDGGRLSSEVLSRELGLGPVLVAAGVRNLRQFLLRGSGWRMVGDAKTGFALEPEDLDILPASLTDAQHRAVGIAAGLHRLA
jgi:hypothetical protein